MSSVGPAFGLAPTIGASRHTFAFSARYLHSRTARPRIASQPLLSLPGPPSPINSYNEGNTGHSFGSESNEGTPSEQAPLANLHELTERIADLLQIGSIEKGKQSPVPAASDGRHGHLNASSHIVVVFGKRLIRDQVSVEYAKRIITLVKQLANGSLEPHIVCFTGGRAPNGQVSEAAAGYAFFRSVCEESGVNVDDYSYLLEEKSSNTVQNIQNIISNLRRRCNPEALTNCHFTLVSSDYHLIRLQEVHRLCVQESALFPLKLFSASWNFIFAAYPFCVSRDPATAFLGRAIVLANDLSTVIVNLSGAVNNRQFMAKENVHRLQETFAKLSDMYRVIDSRSYSGFRTDMRKHAETLELAIHRVREVHTTLLPLQKDGVTVSRADMELSLRLLMSVVRDIRESMDPDRVLLLGDRIAVVEDMAHFVSRENRRRSSKKREIDDVGGAQGSDNNKQWGNSNTTNNAIDVPYEEDEFFDAEFGDGRRRKTSMVSELASNSRKVFAGNGKRIARDGPNVVVLDDMAESSSEVLRSAVLDDVSNAVAISNGVSETKQTRARRSSTAESPRGGALRGARAGASGPRKRRTTSLSPKPKTNGSPRASAKRKAPAKRGEVA